MRDELPSSIRDESPRTKIRSLLEAVRPSTNLCRSKIGFWHVTCVISDVRRLARIRGSGRSGLVFGGSATCWGLLR
jgi:hypothetical protein